MKKTILVAAMVLGTALFASAAITITTNGLSNGDSTLGIDFEIDAVGTAADVGGSEFGVAGSTTQAGAFTSTIGITLDAMKTVDTTPATRGDKLTDGGFNGGNMGVDSDPNGGGIGSDVGGSEGFNVAFDTITGFDSGTAIQITSININNLADTDESFFMVNLATRAFIEFVADGSTDFDVSSLNLTSSTGSATPVAALYSGAIGGFRVSGITLDAIAVPEPTALGLLVACGGGLLFIRKRRS